MTGRRLLNPDSIDVPHLSCRCWKCGDSTSMPPRSAATLVVTDFDESRFQVRRDLYAILFSCTNARCYGATIGYYTLDRENHLEYEFHAPPHRSYKAPEEIPRRPRTLLQHAHDSRRAPSACVTTAVRAVEAMLAEKGYRERKLGLMGRIKKAVADGKLPGVMEDWALEVREIATDIHTDEEPASLPDEKEADRALTYATMLANYLFVMPAEIEKHRAKRKSAVDQKAQKNNPA